MKNPYCRTDALPWPVYGVLDKEDSRNAYRAYTIVNVLYCSGDNHAGNVVRNFTDVNGNYAKQRGAVNVHAVLQWVEKQQQAGHLASKLEYLVVMGCSAGALAAQVWGNEIIRRLQYPKRAAVVADSYIGLFPADLEGQMMYDYGMCDLYFLTDDMRVLCERKQASVAYWAQVQMQLAPQVPYLFLHSRTDRVQIKYYNYLVESFGLEEELDEEGFVEGADAMLEKFNALSNFVVYYVDSSQHCFTPTPYMFFADTEGLGDYEQNDDGDDANAVDDDDVFSVDIETETMNKWLSRAPLPVGRGISSQCSEGQCSELLVPKEYRQFGTSSDKGSYRADVVDSSYRPSPRVMQMHNVPHVDSRFRAVDNSFNMTTRAEWTSYTESLVTVPVMIYTIGVFAVLVFLFFLCMRGSRFTYTRFSHDDFDNEWEQGTLAADKKNAMMMPPVHMIQIFWACLGAALVLNMLLLVGNAQVSAGTSKGDDSLYHLQRAFQDLESISDSALEQADSLTFLLGTANDNGCDKVSYATLYLEEFEEYTANFQDVIEPMGPKVSSTRKKVDAYAVDKKNALVLTIFIVVCVSLALFVAAWQKKSVGALKGAIGVAIIVVFLGYIFATLYMIFLVSHTALVCVQPFVDYCVYRCCMFLDCLRRFLHESH